MAELKFIKPGLREGTSVCCGPAKGALQATDEVSCKTGLPLQGYEPADMDNRNPQD